MLNRGRTISIWLRAKQWDGNTRFCVRKAGISTVGTLLVFGPGPNKLGNPDILVDFDEFYAKFIKMARFPPIVWLSAK